MLLAFAAILIPLAAILPLIRAASSFTSGFWSAPEMSLLLEFLQQLLLPLSLLAIPVMACLALVRALASSGAVGSDLPVGGLRVEDVVLILTLLALPLVGFAVGISVTGAFHGRYVLPAVLGLAGSVGWIIARAPRSAVERVAALGVLLVTLGLQQAGGLAALLRSSPDPLGIDRLALSAAGGRLPIVASPALVYLPLVHHAPPDAAARILYLMKPAEVAAVTPTTSDRALRALSRYVPLPFDDYDRFVSEHPEFLLYGRQTWLAPLLIERGARLELVGTFGDRTLYRARVGRP